MLITNEKILRRVLMLSIFGTRGGLVRLKILLMIKESPHNTNELSKKLDLDYKSVQHHIRVLEKSGLIMSSKKKYGNEYKLSTLLESNKNILREILGNMGKSK